eukprot:7663812-Pyramimonas_sp.AAC.2
MRRVTRGYACLETRLSRDSDGGTNQRRGACVDESTARGVNESTARGVNESTARGAREPINGAGRAWTN